MMSISIHAAREGGDAAEKSFLAMMAISIHAAREGGDEWTADDTGVTKISIHAAREGGDGTHPKRLSRIRNFNPRRP